MESQITAEAPETAAGYTTRFLAFFRERFSNIQKNYTLAREQSDAEGYHQLRVEIKRLRAFFNLIEAVNPRFIAKRQIKPFRRTFKAAAPVRDLHVQQQIIEKILKSVKSEFNVYRKYLKQLERAAVVSFEVFCDEYDLPLLQNRELPMQRALAEVPENTAKRRALQRRDELLGRLLHLQRQDDVADTDLHQVRILSKETRYTIEIIQVCFPEVKPQAALIKGLKQLHQVLGDWHDLEVCQEYLNRLRAAAHFGKDFEEKTYQLFERRVAKEKLRLVERFRRRWNKFTRLFATSEPPE